MSLLFKILLRDKYIYLICLIIFIVYSIFHFTTGMAQIFNAHLYIKPIFKALLISICILIAFYFFYLALKRDPHPLRAYARLLVIPFRYWQEAVNFILITLSISVVLSIYTTMKSLIPALNPFYLDPWLTKLDYFIHFGHMPWEITHAIFSTPAATATINFIYNIWFFIMWVFFVVCLGLVKLPQLRQQALICFCLVWMINGIIAATFMSSVGPCFYTHVYPGADVFADLMARLNSQNELLLAQDNFFNIWAIKTQNLLWGSYVNSTNNLGAGISALPSMHISIATLIALTLSSSNRKLAVLGWLYVLVIEIGSVHLAWHYAVDGYLAIAMTSLVWLSVKVCLRKLASTKTQSEPEWDVYP